MKHIKKLLLIAGLVSSLTITSYASNQDENKNLNDNCKKKTTKKLVNIGIPFSYTTYADYYDDYSNNFWDLDVEVKEREKIKKRLEEFDKIYNNINKTYTNANILNYDFNRMQSILLDYYDFSLLFNKYNMFVRLTKSATKLHESLRYQNFMKKYNEFIDSIKDSVKNIDKFVEDLLFSNIKLNFKNIPIEDNDKKHSENKYILKKISKVMLYMEAKFQKLFQNFKIDIKKQDNLTDDEIDPLWQKTFTDEQFDNNNFININSNVKNLETFPMVPKEYPKNDFNDNINAYAANEFPPHYRINLHILAAILKMELTKSFFYMKDLKNFNLDTLDTDNNEYYKNIHQYVNNIYKFYNTLRCFMITVGRELGKHCYEEDFVQFLKLKPIYAAKQNLKNYLKKYIYKNQNNDSIYTYIYKNKEKKLPENIFQQYYYNLHKIKDLCDMGKFYKSNNYILQDTVENIYKNFIYNENYTFSISGLDRLYKNLDSSYFKEFSKINVDMNTIKIPFQDDDYNTYRTFKKSHMPVFKVESQNKNLKKDDSNIKLNDSSDSNFLGNKTLLEKSTDMFKKSHMPIFEIKKQNKNLKKDDSNIKLNDSSDSKILGNKTKRDEK